MNPYKLERQLAMNDFEIKYLTELLRVCGGNLSHMERSSGVSRRHLRQLFIKYGLYPQVIQNRIDHLEAMKNV